MDLRKYDGKRIRLTDVDGSVFTGYADYHDAEDNASNISSLSLDLDGDIENLQFKYKGDVYIDFEEPEIANVEIITNDNPVMAEAI